MSKFCPKCGNELNDNANFCNKCGEALNLKETKEESSTTVINNVYVNNNLPVITKRDILTAVILSFVTCGIYGIYWFITMTDESNTVNGNDNRAGGLAFLFSLLSCGIYFYYWNYKMGQKMHEAGKRYGKDIQDNSVLYLVLSLFGFGIVNYCLIQNDLNKFAE